jgi:formylglycine-generating enzyme required for sulfatase activity
MRKMARTVKKQWGIFFVVGGVFFSLPAGAAAADKVVVIPLGGAPGNAVAADVVKGKTFSSRAAGKGVAGTLSLKIGKIYINTIGMKFSLIPSGSFVMGSPDGRNGDGNDTHRPYWPSENGFPLETQHVVILTRPFYMQTTEVTQAQWEQVMGLDTNLSRFRTCGVNCPVENVSWDDAQSFIQALNAQENRFFSFSSVTSCYALPTESQWEYAARAGTITAIYNGAAANNFNCSPLDFNLDKIGWYCGNAGDTTHPAAEKDSNNWGLYDMSGNVSEWCEDAYGEYPDGPVTDPICASGSTRVIRGGSWFSNAVLTRSAHRLSKSPDQRSSDVGFRLVLDQCQ